MLELALPALLFMVKNLKEATFGLKLTTTIAIFYYSMSLGRNNHKIALANLTSSTESYIEETKYRKLNKRKK